MSGPIFRVVLGILAAAWTLEAAAQDRAAFNAPSDYASESFSPSADALAYVADPSESYVVEGALADEAEAAQQQQTAQASAPACRAYFPAGAAGDRSGTLCEQTDGSLRIVQAPAFTAAATAPPRASQYCREYQQTVSAGGRPRTAYGKACRLPDGSWQIVTPPTFAETPDFEAHRSGPRSYAAETFAPAYQPPPIQARAAAAPVPARSYTPPVRAYDNRPRLPEFYFGNLFWWLPRAKHETGRYRDRDRYED